MPAQSPRRRTRVVMSPEDRREAILKAAGEVFSTIGFSKATTATVAEAAGIAQGTIYLYFESKEHLLAAVWERYVEALLHITNGILDRGDDWWSTVDSLWAALLEHAVRNAELHRTVYGSSNAKALELCKEINQRVIDVICAYVARGAEAGAFQATAPTMTCRMIYHAVDGLLDDLISQHAEINLPELTAWVHELTHRALTAPTPRVDFANPAS
ncbi:TetR/AcrR family transcriptional regulator [Goodfellowiella coeruleoviolacea]|uniref:Transcriptional regulator, TetR family n=1 Tax=Goodfellowiella coeruleoviolacea TaxID=334858 RepID=A0AAE3GCJ3_9PSEU|nr:TetR/AcrR family transcriptional regulator [Goodfellowiella coeruleoviolacea]MCP2164757.1 transcriptional regulator, TetR family [Goodfellowiella coeruleoviolacea]